MSQTTPRSCVIVLGMHRSGTSALSKTICDMGFSLPSESMPAHCVDNPNGYYEPKKLVQTHNQFLISLGLKWNAIDPLPEDAFSSKRAQATKKVLFDLLENAFKRHSQLVVKDPRLCRLLPLLLAVLEELNCQVAIVFIVRKVSAVFQSLAKRQQTPEIASAAINNPDHVDLLWLRHNVEAEYHSRTLPRFCFSYEDWLENSSDKNNQILGFLRDVLPGADICEPLESLQKPRHLPASEIVISDTQRVIHSVYNAIAGRPFLSDPNVWFDNLYALSCNAIPEQSEALENHPVLETKIAAYLKHLSASSATDLALWAGDNLDSISSPIVFISQTPTTRSHIYRVKNPVDALIKSGRIAFWSTPEVVANNIHVIKRAARVIIHRSEWSEALASIAAMCVSNQIPLSYDIDDLVIDPQMIKSGHIDFINRKSDVVIERWLNKTANYYRALALCDDVICSTAELARHIEKMGHHCCVLSNGFSEETRLVSEHWRLNEPVRLDDFKRIGYASGTPTHDADFAIIVKPLAAWLNANPDWKFTAIGHLQLSALGELVDKNQLETRPLVQHVNLAYELARLDINLIPLQDNPFCSAKSPLKWYEAALCGTPSIISVNPTYSAILGASGTCLGLLAGSDSEWIKHMDTLAESAHTRQKMADSARLYSENNLHIESLCAGYL
jgi:hypothetical protein